MCLYRNDDTKEKVKSKTQLKRCSVDGKPRWLLLKTLLVPLASLMEGTLVRLENSFPRQRRYHCLPFFSENKSTWTTGVVTKPICVALRTGKKYRCQI